MPAAPAVDPATKEAVKAHVISHGVRPAARHFGLNEDTVSAWSAKGKWLQAAHKTMQAMANPSQAIASNVPLSMRPKVSNASTPSQAALSAKQIRDARIHRNGVGYADHTLRHAHRTARKEPERALAMAADVKAVVSIAQAANVAGFERQQAGNAGVVVNLAVLDRTVQATVEHGQSQESVSIERSDK